jgi:hypothetical protein
MLVSEHTRMSYIDPFCVWPAQATAWERAILYSCVGGAGETSQNVNLGLGGQHKYGSSIIKST